MTGTAGSETPLVKTAIYGGEGSQRGKGGPAGPVPPSLEEASESWVPWEAPLAPTLAVGGVPGLGHLQVGALVPLLGHALGAEAGQDPVHDVTRFGASIARKLDTVLGKEYLLPVCTTIGSFGCHTPDHI